MLLGNLQHTCREIHDLRFLSGTAAASCNGDQTLPHPSSLPFFFPFPQICPYIPVPSPSIFDKNIPPSTFFSISPPPPLLTDWKSVTGWKTLLKWLPSNSWWLSIFVGFASACLKESWVSLLSYLLPLSFILTHLYLSHPATSMSSPLGWQHLCWSPLLSLGVSSSLTLRSFVQPSPGSSNISGMMAPSPPWDAYSTKTCR